MPHETSAFVFLVLLVCLLLLWTVVRFVRTSFTLSQCVIVVFCVLITRLLWRVSIPRRFPLQGDDRGAVIISNHRSTADSFLIQVCSKRLVHWMVIRETFKQRFGGWVMRVIRAIPVRRSGIDTAATKTAIRYAAGGRLLGIFPEGRINETDDLMIKIRPGAALIALRAQVPILPCYIEGAPFGGTELSPFLMTAHVRVVFGDPIDLSSFYDKNPGSEALRSVMKLCVAEIARLAGQPDFEPQFAGRKWAETPESD